MPRVIRKTVPKLHVVIVDTNVLWHKDKSTAVSPGFDAAWEEIAKLARLELVIPETVREELAFQHTSSAWKRLDSVVDALGDISEIAAKPHRTRLTRDQLKKQVADKITRWLKTRKARIASLPVASIDLKQLASDAVWRIPPFTSDPKNPDLEKGFRDALILAIVADVVSGEKRDVNLVFVSGDNLLRRTAQQQVKDARFSAYEDIAGFASYVKLTKEKLDNAFIKDILNRAAEKFYTPSDQTSLYLRDKLADRVRSEFADYFNDPDRSDTSSVKLLSDVTLLGPWSAVDAGKWFLAHPEFVSLEPDRIYHWKSRLSFQRAYRRKPLWLSPLPGPSVPMAGDVWNEHILVLPFDIYWRAFVKSDARFYDVAVERVELSENTFRTPTDLERKAFGLVANAG
jgi:hypothetical protein